MHRRRAFFNHTRFQVYQQLGHFYNLVKLMFGTAIFNT